LSEVHGLASTIQIATRGVGRAESPALPADLGAQLNQLAGIRLQKCLALLPRVLGEEDSDAVHAFRVWSRRLQQVVVTISPLPLPPDGQAIVRTLRRARRALSGWRDCDVLIDLLERKIRRLRNADEKRGWEMIRGWALGKRKRQLRHARHKLANRALLMLPQRVRKLMDARVKRAEERRTDLAAVLSSSIGESYQQWRKILSRACESLDPADIHAFRVASKGLRYRIELARDLDATGAETALVSLRTLQDHLGRWHDHIQLTVLAAEALADPEFLLAEPCVAALVLRKLARDNAGYKERVRQLLANTTQDVDRSALHLWVGRYCAVAPAVVDATSSERAGLVQDGPIAAL
jgi:CHAD domain-containing protein